MESIAATRNLIIVSVGGGHDAVGLLDLATTAWAQVRRKLQLGDWRMIVFSGLVDKAFGAATPTGWTNGVLSMPFSLDYLEWMRSSRLSISHAGYNTCADILLTGCRALLIPNPAMSDQLLRSRVMQRLGCSVAEPAGLSVERLSERISEELGLNATLAKPLRVPNINGARNSAALIASYSETQRRVG
jgi:predicted glycosyltransferase